MKKIIIASGGIALILLILLLTGAAADDSVKYSARRGGDLYGKADYGGALSAYEEGLAVNPNNKILNFNAAQAAYLLYDYQKSAEFYEKSVDATQKFINLGNIGYRVGESIPLDEITQEDLEAKVELYMFAVQTYCEGIESYPESVILKYNYEFVLEKLLELLDFQEQQEEQSGDGEDEENEEGEEGEESEGEQSEGEESEESEQYPEEDEQGEEAESYEESEEDESEQDRDAIERILQMLESQEEESLKNNQEVIRGSGDKNAW